MFECIVKNLALVCDWYSTFSISIIFSLAIVFHVYDDKYLTKVLKSTHKVLMNFRVL